MLRLYWSKCPATGAPRAAWIDIPVTDGSRIADGGPLADAACKAAAGRNAPTSRRRVALRGACEPAREDPPISVHPSGDDGPPPSSQDRA
jgi:hypothetical protein